MSVVVRFHDPGEFCDELAARPPDVEPVVRLTRRYTRSVQAVPLQSLEVVASYLRRGGGDVVRADVVRLVELTARCGTVWPGGPSSPDADAAEARAERASAAVRVAADVVGVEVAAGVYALGEGGS